MQSGSSLLFLKGIIREEEGKWRTIFKWIWEIKGQRLVLTAYMYYNDQKSCITLVLPSQPAGMVQWGVSKYGSVGAYSYDPNMIYAPVSQRINLKFPVVLERGKNCNVLCIKEAIKTTL